MSSGPQRTILFLESGSSGGGSYAILHRHLAAIQGKYQPVVGHTNRTPWFERAEELDVAIHLIPDPIYSRTYPALIRKALARMRLLVDRYAGWAFLPLERFIHAPAVNRVRALVRAYDVDLIHANDQVNRDLYAVEAARLEGIPCVCHLRSTRNMGFDAARARFVNQWVSSFVAASEATRAYWLDLGLDPARTVTIYDGLPDADPETVDLRRFGIDPGTRTVVSVGTMNRAKGHGFLLDAFARLRETELGVHLLLVGDGELRAELEARVSELGLNPHVTFAGYQPDAQAIIAASDVLALSSQTENLALVVLEAMQVGTPVVSTDVGGMSEAVEDGKTGHLVSYGDVEGFARALHRTLSDPRLSAQLAQRAKKLVEERFSIRTYVDALDGVYTEALAQAGSATSES